MLLWQAVEQFINPVPVQGIVPVIVGLAAAAANWGVARLLLKPSEHNAAIQLAYIHNLGDVWVSLAPVSAGLLLILTGYSIFDPLIAGGVAVWIIASTAREVVGSHDELIWPEKLVCCHTDHETTAVEPGDSDRAREMSAPGTFLPCRPRRAMSASLIGHSGSSDYPPLQYRCRSRARASLRNRHQGPFRHGIRGRGGTIYRAALPSDER